jgi:hypothetical protein
MEGGQSALPESRFVLADPVSTRQNFGAQQQSASLPRALQVFIESEFGAGRYAGPCVNAISPRDLGKRCTLLIADEGSRLAFLDGPTFSEYTRWIFVERASGGGWRVYQSLPFDFFGSVQPVPWP